MIGSAQAPVVCAWGGAGALGLDAWRLALLLRAGRNRFRRAPIIDAFGERVVMSLAPGVGFEVRGAARAAWLGRLAFRECADAALAGARAPRVRVALALPERAGGPGPGTTTPWGRQVIDSIGSELAATGAAHEIVTFSNGRAGGALALQSAIGWVAQDTGAVVIVGGIDTYLDRDALEPWFRNDRVATPEQPDGSIPGEAAAFVALRGPQAPGPSAVARVIGSGTGVEPAPLAPGGGTSTTVGLTQALRDALRPLREAKRRASYWISDLTNDPYRLSEVKRVFARFGDVIGPDVDWVTPLRELGDVGAAALPLSWVLACESWRGGWAADAVAVTFAGSDGSERGAAVLEEVPCR